MARNLHIARARNGGDRPSRSGQNQHATANNIILSNISLLRGAGIGIDDVTVGQYPLNFQCRSLSQGHGGGIYQVQTTTAHIGAEFRNFCFDPICTGTQSTRTRRGGNDL